MADTALLIKLVSKAQTRIAEAYGVSPDTIRFRDIVVKDGAEFELLKQWRKSEEQALHEKVRRFVKSEVADVGKKE